MPAYYCGGSTFTATTATSTVFSYWVDTTATTTSSTIWSTWIRTARDEGTGATTWQAVDQQRYEPTAEELAARELRMAERREQARQEQLAKRRAQRRALALLLRFIAPEQREDLRRHGHFQVRGGATGCLYRIRRGRVANIDVLDAAGTVLRRLCAHPALDVPDSDTMLAQALYLQSAANEEQFVRTANVHPIR